jgi:hypothetical protein
MMFLIGVFSAGLLLGVLLARLDAYLQDTLRLRAYMDQEGFERKQHP